MAAKTNSCCALCSLLLASSSAEKAKVCIGSQRSVKLRAASECLIGAEIIGAPEFDSSVSDWPIGLAETSKGARHRAAMALELCPSAQFGLGVESGFRERQKGDEDDPWIVYVCAVLIQRAEGGASPMSLLGISGDLDTPITDSQRKAQIQEALVRAINTHQCTET